MKTMKIGFIPVTLITEMLADYDQWAHDVPSTFHYKEIADTLALEVGLAKEVWIDEDGNEIEEWELPADHEHELTIVRLD